ncbi:protein YLS3-like [Papaver somniferum]|uniref:protein YLS3-like n=1 Tax=Papaver somniferum TaxID=3469 RepID=UPI000E6FE2B3|nr:protein YLS3-like [Papaver somniferum]
MASHSSFHILSLLLLLLISTPFAFPEAESPSTGSDIIECGSRLLTLVPCLPYVQGTMPAPARLCCDNLMDLYVQEENCLCVLLSSDNPINFFSINQTLALRLPALCRIKLDTTSCPGLVPSADSPAPGIQVLQGTSSNTSSPEPEPELVPPMTAMAPMPNMGFRKSNGQKLTFRQAPFVAFATIYLLTRAFI